jgi:hypothetical protein
MSEFTNTYLNRNDLDDGQGKRKTSRSRQSKDKLHESGNNPDEGNTEDNNGPRWTEPESNVGEQSQEELEDNVLSFEPKKKKNSKILGDSLLVYQDKLNQFKSQKKRKYKVRIQKEKQKHFKWKEKCKFIKNKVQAFEQQQNSQTVVQLTDSFGRLIKH